MGYFLAQTIVDVLALLALAHISTRYSLLEALAVLLLAIRFATVAALEVALLLVSNGRSLLL